MVTSVVKKHLLGKLHSYKFRQFITSSCTYTQIKRLTKWMWYSLFSGTHLQGDFFFLKWWQIFINTHYSFILSLSLKWPWCYMILLCVKMCFSFLASLTINILAPVWDSVIMIMINQAPFVFFCYLHYNTACDYLIMCYIIHINPFLLGL